VDYWQYPKTPEFMTKTNSDEMEDRLVSNKSEIPNADKYIISIDVLADNGEIDQSIVDGCKSLNIKLNVFDNKETFSFGNTKHAIKPITKPEPTKQQRHNKAYGIEDIIGVLTYKEPDIYQEIIKSLDNETITYIDDYHKKLKYEITPDGYNTKELAATISSYITNNKQSADKLYRNVMLQLSKDFRKTNSNSVLEYLESKYYKGKKRQADFNEELNDKMTKLINDSINNYLNDDENRFSAPNDGGEQYDNIYNVPEVKTFILDKITQIKKFTSNYFLTNNDKFHYRYKISPSELRDEFDITENNPEAIQISQKFSGVTSYDVIDPILKVLWAIDSMYDEITSASDQLKAT